VGVENYSDSFGEQWNIFSETQVDSLNGSKLSEERFFSETGWLPEDLRDAVVLDAGCGSGRFSEIALKYAKVVISVDFSSAVFAFPTILAAAPNLIRIHGDIRNLPLDFTKVTHVFSIGVLQHTPKPYDTLNQIILSLEPETKIAITAYGKTWYTKIHPKYFWRPITKRLPRRFVLRGIKITVPVVFDLLMLLSRPKKLRKVVKFLSIFSIYPEMAGKLSRKRMKEFMILDTFDALTPAHDFPLSSPLVLSKISEKVKDIEVISETPLVFRCIKR